jgi:hypothetical protein
MPTISPKTLEVIAEIYPIKILQAFDSNAESLRALSTLAKSLTELFRYFEPGFFRGRLFVTKHFQDEFVFNRDAGRPLIDKNVLLDRSDGSLFIQVFDDGRFFIWEDADPAVLSSKSPFLTYFFEANREFFVANKKTIEISEYPYGSIFAPQFYFLAATFEDYKLRKIKNSSCPLFSKAWHRSVKDAAKNLYYDNRVLFQGASDSPEKPIQDSLENFLKDSPHFRGINLEVNREFNVDSDQPKPVDFRVTWLEANRMALIELKWVGDSISANENLKPRRDARVNEGLVQLKGYWDSARRDYPNKLMKAFLVVIDGRRRGLTKDSVEVTFANGFYYQNREFAIQDDRKYFDEIVGFEEPLRMFAEPLCVSE